MRTQEKKGAHVLIIDRFEGDFAVVEYEQGETFNLPRCLLSPEAREGDVIRITVAIDVEETIKRKKRIADMIDDLLQS